jgi:hypothetical protein
MRFNTIIVVLLLGLLVFSLTNCSADWQLRRLKRNHPEKFITKTDTIITELVLKDTITIPIYRDTAKYESHLEEYVSLRRSLERLSNRPTGVEANLDEWRLLQSKIDSVKKYLYSGVFEKTEGFYRDSVESFVFVFDPLSPDPLTIHDRKIKQPTIRQKTDVLVEKGMSLQDWVKMIGIVVTIFVCGYFLFKIIK